MTEQEHPLDFLPELALGILPQDEAVSIRDHVRGCETCAAELAEMERVTALLPLAAQEMAPSESVRASVMERIAREPHPADAPGRVQSRVIRRQPWQWLTATAAAAVLILIGGLVGWSIADDNGNASAREDQLVESAARGTMSMASAQASNGARATLVRAPGSSQAFVWVQDLPALPAGKAYQAWFTKDGQTFEPSSVFSTATGGVWLPAEGDLDGYAAMGLTIEDDGGAKAPSSSPFVAVDLQTAARKP